MPNSGLPPVQDNFEGNSEYRSVDDVGNGDDNDNGEDDDSVDAVGNDQDNDGGQDDSDQISPKRRLFATISSKC